MTYWARQGVMITLGGAVGVNRLNEVQQFVMEKNEWKVLPSLPEKISGSSATVVEDVLYNIGGDESTNSVSWLDLFKSEWNSVLKLRVADFSDQGSRDATVVANKIVYFGSKGQDKATYVLEKGEEGGLEVKQIFTAIDYRRGLSDSSFCTYKEKIYFYPWNKYSEVWCLDKQSQCSLFFSR